MSYRCVSAQGGHVGEGPLAGPALVGLLSGVDALVPPQSSLLREGLPTLLTEIGTGLWEEQSQQTQG